jgi:trk system potassium uptake protein TrkH
LLQNAEKASLSQRLGRPMRVIGPIYIALTALGVIGIMASGGSLFDALCMSLSAISTTGFITHSQGIAAQFTPLAQVFIATLTLIGALSAPVLVILGVGKKMRLLGQDSELRVLLILIVVYAILSYAILQGVTTGTALLQAISLFTTAGFNFLPGTSLQNWPVFWVMLPVLFGGMAFSTAGGVKMMRAIILTKGVSQEISKLAYPSSVQPMTLDGRRLEEPNFSAIWAYTSVFLACLAGGILLLGLFGIGLEEGWPIILGALTNSLAITAGLDINADLGAMSPYVQYFLTLLMIAGRIEILILMMLFTSSFWRFTR